MPMRIHKGKMVLGEGEDAMLLSASANTFSIKQNDDVLMAVSKDEDSNTTIVVTVQLVSGSNKYHLDNQDRPTISLNIGQTYTFDISDSSLGIHPFKLSTTQDGIHGTGGALYTDSSVTYGTNSVTIVVSATTPTPLYYYCGVHPGMGGQINVI